MEQRKAYLLICCLNNLQCCCCFLLCDIVEDVLPVLSASPDHFQPVPCLPRFVFTRQALVEHSQLHQVIHLTLGDGANSHARCLINPSRELEHLAKPFAIPAQWCLWIMWESFSDVAAAGTVPDLLAAGRSAADAPATAQFLPRAP
jgi:hypothetical protein